MLTHQWDFIIPNVGCQICIVEHCYWRYSRWGVGDTNAVGYTSRGYGHSSGNLKTNKQTTIKMIEVHIMQLYHIRLAKSSFYFWPIIRFSVLKLWLVLSLGTFFTEIRSDPSKVYLFLDADKFVRSFLLISSKKQLCRI